MSSLLALLSALSYGAGDFLGGVAARKTVSVIPVIVISHVVGLGLIVTLIPLFPGELTAEAVALGVVAGLAGAVGIGLLYRGLAIGRMSVVAPITGVGAATLPFAWGLVLGERPAVAAIVGAVIAVIAIPAVAASDEGSDGANRAGLMEAIVAGIAFAMLFIVLDATPGDSGVIPLIAARVGSITVFSIAAVAMGRSLRMHGEVLRLTLGAGALDMLANAFFIAATRVGLLGLSSVLASLYPAVTILLAHFVLHEGIGRTQKTGLLLALVGVVLIATG